MESANDVELWTALFDPIQRENACNAIRNCVDRGGQVDASVGDVIEKYLLRAIDLYIKHIAAGTKDPERLKDLEWISEVDSVVAARAFYDAAEQIREEIRAGVSIDLVASAAMLDTAWKAFIVAGAAPSIYDDVPRAMIKKKLSSEKHSEIAKRPRKGSLKPMPNGFFEQYIGLGELVPPEEKAKTMRKKYFGDAEPRTINRWIEEVVAEIEKKKKT